MEDSMNEHKDLPLCKEVRILEKEFKDCQKLLTAVGDVNRQYLLCTMLKSPIEGMRVIDIAKTSSLSRPAISHHMQILKDAGIVKSRKEGTCIYYYLDPDSNQITTLLSLVERLTKIMKQLPDRSEK